MVCVFGTVQVHLLRVKRDIGENSFIREVEHSVKG